MTTNAIKKELNHLINEADERLLKMMHAFVKEYNNYESDYALSAEEKGEIDRLKKLYKNKSLKTKTWNESKANIYRKISK